jgi:hypothetical protein
MYRLVVHQLLSRAIGQMQSNLSCRGVKHASARPSSNRIF